MVRVAILTITCILVWNIGTVLLCTMEIGKQHSAKCFKTATNGQTLTWLIRNTTNKKIRTLATCVIGGACSGYDTKKFNVSLTGSSSSPSTFTILNVSINVFNEEEYLQCQVGSSTNKLNRNTPCYGFSYYAKPLNVTCDAPKFTETHLIVACRTEKVLPKAECDVYIDSPGLIYRRLTVKSKNISYHHETLATDPDYFSSECQVKIPVTELIPGSLKLHIKLIPENWFNLKYITYEIKIVPPTAQLVGACPGGPYVKSGLIPVRKTGMCTCSLSSPGNPPILGSVVWFNDNGEPSTSVKIEKEGSTLTVSYNPTEVNQSYTCRGFSAVGYQEPGVTFTPVFDHNSAMVQNFEANNTQESLVAQKESSVKLMCKASGNPVPDITLIKENQTSPEGVDRQPAVVYEAKKKLTAQHTLSKVDCTDAGVYVCQAKNSGSDGNEDEKKLQLFVTCPLQLASGHGGSNLTTKLYNSVTVRTRVFGYPPPTQYILTRGDSLVPLPLVTVSNSLTQGIAKRTKYAVMYSQETPPFGTVNILINGFQQEDASHYILLIRNGIGDGLPYQFTLKEDQEGDCNGLAIGIGIGIGVCVLVAIVVVIGGVCWYRRQRVDEAVTARTTQPYCIDNMEMRVQASGHGDCGKPMSRENQDHTEGKAVRKDLQEKLRAVKNPISRDNNDPDYSRTEGANSLDNIYRNVACRPYEEVEFPQ